MGRRSLDASAALVVVTSSFPISGDGSEAAGTFVADLVEEVAKGGVLVRVVAPGRSTHRENWCTGVEVFRYASPSQPLSTLKLWKPVDAAKILRTMLSGQAATESAVAYGSTRQILALWALPCGDWARRAARKHGLGYSIWTLGSDIWTLGRIPVVRTHLRRVLQGAEYCWSDGLKLAEDTRSIAGREVAFLPSTRRIRGARAAALKTAAPYRLLFLGRWHPNKGVDLLLDALKVLNDAAWKRIEVVEICGGGPLERMVRSGVEDLQAAGRPVQLRGFLDRVSAEDALLRCDWVLIPSRIESIPVVFSDAMKLGCPVVVMPVGDLPELVATTPSAGYVAATTSAEGFAAAISSALASSVADFASGLADRAGNFDLKAVASQVLPGRERAPDA